MRGARRGPRSAGGLAAGEALNSSPVKWGQPLPEGAENRTRPRRSAAGSTPCAVSASPRVHPKAEAGSRRQASIPATSCPEATVPRGAGSTRGQLQPALHKGSLPGPPKQGNPCPPPAALHWKSLVPTQSPPMGA